MTAKAHAVAATANRQLTATVKLIQLIATDAVAQCATTLTFSPTRWIFFDSEQRAGFHYRINPQELLMRKMLLCPSLINLELAELKEELPKINDSDVDILHLDLMDGTFVPNFGMSLREIEYIRKLTSKKIDCHMMVMEPRRWLKNLQNAGVDIVYIHPDSELIPSETLLLIKTLGMQAGLVLNPACSIASVEDLLPVCDYVMVMGVNPGFAGRDFLDWLLPKFKKLSELRKASALNFHIVLDGGATFEVIKNLYTNYDIEGYVLGKQEYFFQQRSYAESVRRIRNIA